MDSIDGVSRASAIAAPTQVIPAERAAENRAVVQAVKALNAAEMFGRDSELKFQLDQRSQRMLLRVVDRGTGEVILQVPPETVLRLAEHFKEE